MTINDAWDLAQGLAAHHPETATGVICHMCRALPAKHKVAEVIDTEWPIVARQLQHGGSVEATVSLARHELTAYLCCSCFGQVMGAVAQRLCREAR